MKKSLPVYYKEKKISGKHERQSPTWSFLSQWGFFLIFSILFIWLTRSIFNPVFLTNDNQGIIGIAKNDFLAPYVHFLWSRLLTNLYAFFPQIPWYGLLLYALQAISLSLVLTIFYRTISKFGFFSLFAIILLFFWADMIVRLDYSGTSIMIGTCAVLLFLILQREDRMNLWIAFLLGIFLAFSSLPRSSGILAVIIIALPFLSVQCFITAKQGVQRNKILTRMTCLVAVLLLPGFISYQVNETYRDNFLTEDEIVYARFNELRGKFHHFKIAEENRENLEVHEVTGWTMADYVRLENWMFFDENIYSIEKLEKFYEYASRSEENSIFSQVNLSLLILLINYSQFLLLMAAGLALSWGRRAYNFHNFIICCIGVGTVLGIALAFELFLRFPYRIGYPMLFSACLFVFFLAMAPRRETYPILDKNCLSEHGHPDIPDIPESIKSIPAWFARGNWNNCSLKHILPYSVILACLIQGIFLSYHYQFIDSRRHLKKALTYHININHPKAFLITEPELSPFHLIDPINPPDQKFTRIPLGWSTFHPRFYQELEKIGLERGSQLMPAVVSRDDIIVLSRQPWMELLLQYSQQEGFGHPQVEVLNDWDDIKLYRLR